MAAPKDTPFDGFGLASPKHEGSINVFDRSMSLAEAIAKDEKRRKEKEAHERLMLKLWTI